ncbi:hypothetical protein SISSUDRAFT_1048740 [Sistotremastrum suecicum HHB10207 ss-3]|uniref:Uncharacterized protein n=1 Tax=Sistotremastrum suecicum HHB10207 ss-3 TaxID=1314776 RepID=A0A166C8Y5_9AGAM|nr:hypothetical protein SISSUDRAFT_1048740 [Sistotremastrum suecicum HHB10207 ss-3]
MSTTATTTTSTIISSSAYDRSSRSPSPSSMSTPPPTSTAPTPTSVYDRMPPELWLQIMELSVLLPPPSPSYFPSSPHERPSPVYSPDTLRTLHRSRTKTALSLSLVSLSFHHFSLPLLYTSLYISTSNQLRKLIRTLEGSEGGTLGGYTKRLELAPIRRGTKTNTKRGTSTSTGTGGSWDNGVCRLITMLPNIESFISTPEPVKSLAPSSPSSILQTLLHSPPPPSSSSPLPTSPSPSPSPSSPSSSPRPSPLSPTASSQLVSPRKLKCLSYLSPPGLTSSTSLINPYIRLTRSHSQTLTSLSFNYTFFPEQITMIPDLPFLERLEVSGSWWLDLDDWRQSRRGYPRTPNSSISSISSITSNDGGNGNGRELPEFPKLRYLTLLPSRLFRLTSPPHSKIHRSTLPDEWNAIESIEIAADAFFLPSDLGRVLGTRSPRSSARRVDRSRVDSRAFGGDEGEGRRGRGLDTFIVDISHILELSDPPPTTHITNTNTNTNPNPNPTLHAATITNTNTNTDFDAEPRLGAEGRRWREGKEEVGVFRNVRKLGVRSWKYQLSRGDYRRMFDLILGPSLGPPPPPHLHGCSTTSSNWSTGSTIQRPVESRESKWMSETEGTDGIRKARKARMDSCGDVEAFGDSDLEDREDREDMEFEVFDWVDWVEGTLGESSTSTSTSVRMREVGHDAPDAGPGRIPAPRSTSSLTPTPTTSTSDTTNTIKPACSNTSLCTSNKPPPLPLPPPPQTWPTPLLFPSLTSLRILDQRTCTSLRSLHPRLMDGVRGRAGGRGVELLGWDGGEL